MGTRSRLAHGLVTWRALWRIRALHELHYRANLLINLLQVVIDLAVGLVVVRLVFTQVDELNGWSEPELLVVLGTATILDALLRAIVVPNMWAIIRDVEEGTFDSVLLMPADEQLVVTARELSVWDLSGVVVGAAVTIYGAARLDAISVGNVVTYALLLPAGLAIVYGFFLAVTSLAFRLINLNDLLFRLTQNASYSGRWPLGIFPGWLRVSMTLIVPMGVAVTIPSSALAGRMAWSSVALSFVAATLVVAVSRWIFRRGIRSYSGASA